MLSGPGCLQGARLRLERRSRGDRPRAAGRKPRQAATRPGRSGTPLATADVEASGGFAPQSPDVATEWTRLGRVNSGGTAALRRPGRRGRRFVFCGAGWGGGGGGGGG